jgi:hypothetical protein
MLMAITDFFKRHPEIVVGTQGGVESFSPTRLDTRYKRCAWLVAGSFPD